MLTQLHEIYLEGLSSDYIFLNELNHTMLINRYLIVSQIWLRNYPH